MKKYAQAVKLQKGMEHDAHVLYNSFPQLKGTGSIYSKGMVIRPVDMKKGIRMGYDGDDFARNLFTIIVEQWCFRAPRILNRVYATNKQRSLKRWKNKSATATALR